MTLQSKLLINLPSHQSDVAAFAWSIGVWLYWCYVTYEVMRPTAGMMTYDFSRANTAVADTCLKWFQIDVDEKKKPQETMYWMPLMFPLVLAQIAV